MRGNRTAWHSSLHNEKSVPIGEAASSRAVRLEKDLTKLLSSLGEKIDVLVVSVS